MAAECRRVYAIHRGKILQVLQKHGGFHHFSQCGTSSLDNRAQIIKDLLRLHFNLTFHEAAIGAKRYLSGGKHEITGDNCLGIRPDSGWCTMSLNLFHRISLWVVVMARYKLISLARFFSKDTLIKLKKGL